jgi:Holliday junction resolvase
MKHDSSLQKRARNRGKSNEYSLVKALRNLEIEAERVPLSGALPGMPGDVTAQEISTMFEAKVIGVLTVDGVRYIRINLDWVEKVVREANRAGYTHGVVVIRGNNLKKRYALVPFEEYVKLVKA